MTIEPDQAVFAVVVTSSLTTGLDQVVAPLQGTGITSANLVSVNTVLFPSFAAPSVMGLQWSFVLAIALIDVEEHGSVPCSTSTEDLPRWQRTLAGVPVARDERVVKVGAGAAMSDFRPPGGRYRAVKEAG